MGSHQPIRKVVTPEIPDKLYFRIGDVAKLCELPAYVLRFWETEFPQLKPNKGGTGQRLYRRKDVEIALRIKTLLYDQGYTIAGARQVFKAEAEAKAATPTAAPAAAIAAQPALIVSEASWRASQDARPAEPVTQESLAAMRRRTQVEAMRAELQALAEMLGQPVRRPAAKLHAMRPRMAEQDANGDQQDLF